MISRLVLSIALIVVGMAIGYAIQKLAARGASGPAGDLLRPRRALQRIALLVLNPIAFLGAVWVAPLTDLRIALLPLVGLFAIVVGGFLAFLAGRAFHLSRQQQGAYIVSGSFTNIGSVGALLVFLLLGEPAFALVPVYNLFEQFTYYAVGFPIARSFSDQAQGGDSFGSRVRGVFSDPFVIINLGSIITGFILNIAGVPRPAFYAGLSSVIVPLASLLLLVSIGMAMRFAALGRYFRYSAVVVLIKHLATPLLATGLAWAIGFGAIANGLPLLVVLILSSMPVGFVAMVPPTLYDLDVDLANSNWLLSNIVLIAQIPLLAVLVS